MTAAARRPFPAAHRPPWRAAALAGLSAALHAAVLVALLPRAPVPPAEPVQRPVALVWDSATEGARIDDPPGEPPSPPPRIAAPAAPEAASPPGAPSAPPPPAPPAAARPPPEPLPAPPVPAPVTTPAPPTAAAAPPPPPVAPAGDLPPIPPVAPAQVAAPLPRSVPPSTEPDAASPPPAPPEPPMELATRALPPPPPPAPPIPPAARQAMAPLRQTWSPPTRSQAPAEPATAAGGVARGAVVLPRPSTSAANPSPTYPVASRRRGEQGRVTLLVQVDPSGRVLDLAVLGSSGHPALDEEAARTVRRWRFEPATQDGRTVFSTATVNITFRLEGDRRW